MRRLSALAPLLLLAAAPAPSVPAGTTTLAPDAEERWVPFEMTPGNQMRFAMTLDGQPVSAILDTGVSYSVLAARFARDHGLPVRAAGRAAAIGGAVALGWAATQTVAIGGLSRAGGGVTVAELPATATGTAAPADLLVGRDLLGGAALDLDFAGHRFRLIPSGRMPFAGAVAPLAVSPERRVFVTRARIGAAVLSPVIVDTGDGAAITVSRPGWRAAGLDTLPATDAVAFGIAGPITLGLAIVPELTVGDLTARQVEVRGEQPGGFSEAIGVAGRIGTGFLARYRVLMDVGAGRMVFQPGPDADRAPTRSTSGLLLRLEADRLRVLHVMRGGPAAAAGWKAGDAICSVDGRAVSPDYTAAGLGAWSIGAPGRVVQLGQCGGAVRPLTLARFY